MAFLAGLNDYLKENDGRSTFDEAAGTAALYGLHLHGGTILQAQIAANKNYDIIAVTPDGEQRELQKIQIKLLHPAGNTDTIKSRISVDELIRSQGLIPIVSARLRNHIKNKSLFVLLREQEPVTVTLIEGEVLQGIIQSFSRYEITLVLQGQEQVIILRHAVLDIQDRQGCCFLKTSQQKLRDWTKSKLYVDPRPRSQLRPGLKKTKIKRRQKIIIR
jgi:RNA chaperone Hfq